MVTLLHRRKAFKSVVDNLSITDTDVLDYQSRIIAAGSNISNTQLYHIQTFVQSLKSYGNWSYIERLNPFCGNDLTAALIPLKASIGSSSESNTNFVSGDYGVATGITGGTSKSLNTGVDPISFDRSDCMYGFYNLTSSSSSVLAVMGSNTTTDVGNNRFYVLLNKESGVYKAYFGQGTLFYNSVSLSSARGLLRGDLSISGPYVANWWFGATHLTGSNYNGGGFRSANIVLFGSIHGGAGSTNSGSGYFIGKNSMPNKTQMNSDWDTLITNLGR